MTERPSRTERDPLAYHSDDSAGICLDVDGTTHRTGSVFIETLVFLPYVDTVEWSQVDRTRLRELIGRVAEYADGPDARDRWLRLFSLLDRLDSLGSGWLCRGILDAALRYRTWRERRNGSDAGSGTGSDTGDATSDGDTVVSDTTESGDNAPDDGDYREMRHAVLEAYGDLIQGKRRETLQTAAAEIVRERLSIDTDLHETLKRAAHEADVYLVTDMPEHVARAYARRLTGTPDNVIATTFALDGDGRFTGEVHHVDKRQAVEQLRDVQKWDYLVAAGDSEIDLRMAEAANLFLAVEGQGDIMHNLGSRETVRFGDATDTAAIREAFHDGKDVIEVGRNQDLSAALAAALEAVGILDGNAETEWQAET